MRFINSRDSDSYSVVFQCFFQSIAQAPLQIGHSYLEDSKHKMWNLDILTWHLLGSRDSPYRPHPRDFVWHSHVGPRAFLGFHSFIGF